MVRYRSRAGTGSACVQRFANQCLRAWNMLRRPSIVMPRASAMSLLSFVFCRSLPICLREAMRVYLRAATCLHKERGDQGSVRPCVRASVRIYRKVAHGICSQKPGAGCQGWSTCRGWSTGGGRSSGEPRNRLWRVAMVGQPEGSSGEPLNRPGRVARAGQPAGDAPSSGNLSTVGRGLP